MYYSTVVNEYRKNGDPMLYPNPAGNWITVEIPDLLPFETSYMEIMDISGQKLGNIGIQSQKTLIDFDKSSLGIYFLRTRIEQAVFTKKFIKE